MRGPLRWLAGVAAVITAIGGFAVMPAERASAAAPTKTAWYNEADVAPAPVPPAPTVPSSPPPTIPSAPAPPPPAPPPSTGPPSPVATGSQLEVGQGPQDPAAFAALSYTVDPATTGATLTLQIAPDSASGTPTVDACTITDASWNAGGDQPAAAAPAYDCSTPIVGVASPDGSSETWTLGAPQSGLYDLALVPAAGSTPFTVVYQPPDANALTPQSPAGAGFATPSGFAPGSGGGGGSGFGAFSGGGSGFGAVSGGGNGGGLPSVGSGYGPGSGGGALASPASLPSSAVAAGPTA
ncbi:MAG: hypothetical protein ACRDWW_06695, partial [Acidimicrobiales bacterium]